MSRRELYRIEGIPVFQNKMYPDREAAVNCPRGDMLLAQDLDTGHVFNAAFKPELLVYDQDYQNEQAHSKVFLAHLEEVRGVIDRHFHGTSIIEVGCGKAYFLEFLQRTGYDITGVDPAYEGDNPRVVKDYFRPGLGLTADGIVLRHVLEHVSNPYDFLSTLANANGGRGRIYIEVPCLDWICEHRAWFDIFYEHVNYFRLGDFRRMFQVVHEGGHVFGGQYLYVVADLASLTPPVHGPGDRFRLPSDFLSGRERLASMLAGKRNAIWGGASKGVMFAFFMQQAGVDIDKVIDINPAKQNKYLAGTGLRIQAPGEALTTLQAGDNILVMNSNYLEEIITTSQNRFNYIKVDHDGL